MNAKASLASITHYYVIYTIIIRTVLHCYISNISPTTSEITFFKFVSTN